MKKTIFLLMLCALFISCNDDEDNAEPGSLNLTLSNMVEGQPIQLGNAEYENASSERYVVDELKYILSNIVLVQADGSEFIYPVADSYFLVDEADALSKVISLDNIDAGDYVAVRFGFGVDPMQYPIESGTLNFIPRAEEAGMLWSWSAGYKFLKFEGSYTTPAVTETTPFLFHVGSHGATLDNYKEITLPIGTVTINNTVQPSRDIQFEVATIFNGSNIIAIDNKNEIMVDPVNAPLIADNISGAFSVQE